MLTDGLSSWWKMCVLMWPLCNNCVCVCVVCVCKNVAEGVTLASGSHSPASFTFLTWNITKNSHSPCGGSTGGSQKYTALSLRRPGFWLRSASTLGETWDSYSGPFFSPVTRGGSGDFWHLLWIAHYTLTRCLYADLFLLIHDTS